MRSESQKPARAASALAEHGSRGDAAWAGEDLVADLTAEVQRLARNRDAWRERARRAREESNELLLRLQRREASAEATEEIARLREELRLAAEERDRWAEQAENWRRETQRLVEVAHGRFTHRARRSLFLFARAIWWALPTPLRDRLRTIIFPQAKPVSLPPSERFEVAESAEAVAATRIDEAPLEVGAVSIVMPTFNAGPEFGRVLASIRAQEGIGEAELLIIDSGSTDGTREAAAAAGARVLTIDQGAFQHGRTRNLAIEASSGEIIFMLVQDATLLGSRSLRTLADELQSDASLAAVSARQIPRTDADLFAALMVYGHQTTIANGRANGRRRNTTLQVRAAAALDNVCAAIRRSAWEEVGFAEVDFAEDLDFGLRAVQAGWTIGLSDSVAVAHSHTRSAPYAARRSAVDRLFVADMVADQRLNGSSKETPHAVIQAAHALLREVEGALALHASGGTVPLGEALDQVRAAIEVGAPRLEPTGELAALADLLGQNGGEPDGDVLAALRRELAAVLEWDPLRRFAAAQRVVDWPEFASFTGKLAGLSIGRAVGDSIRRHGAEEASQSFVVGV